MVDLGSKYAKSRLTKDRGNDPLKINKLNSHQENNAMFNSAVDEILLHEN